ncbi:ROK family protein [Bifidobacterium choloepi]|uniref:ROK family protein n=1 Tax=Bifidobacterium choloepi TaxID=2614131 RepID=A0A6I5MY50_9BIFI|nr:ROK family protein [Bifidobacterium choloepi]NEG69528.1 ROK family protein [Bifidobacterium choloepi]
MAAMKRMNQDDLRTHNLSVVLNAMLHADGPQSRADLAKETGLTKATMSLLVTLLINNRIVREGVPLVQSVYGRPSTPLLINGGTMCGIGVQINTDGYGYLVLDLDGTVVAERWISGDLQHADPVAIFGKLDDMLVDQEAALQSRGYTIAGAGLALPGLVTDTRQLLVARNLGWDNLDLTQFALVDRLDAIAGNEANMSAIAQLPGYGALCAGEASLQPNESFIYISTDIGIGGALVRDGKVVIGDRGFAGELGHMSVQMNGPLCQCGRHGCLEVYAGRRSMVEAAGIALGEDGASDEAVRELDRLWREGDPEVKEIIGLAFDAMVSAIVSTINLSDMDTVIIGGLWAQIDDEFLGRMRDGIQDQVLARDVMNIRVLRANSTTRPALLGAAEVGLRRFIDNPLPFLQQ